MTDRCRQSNSKVVEEWLDFYDEQKGKNRKHELCCLPETLGVAFSGGGVRAAASVSALASRSHLLFSLSLS